MTSKDTTSHDEAATRARLRHHVSDEAWRAGYSMPCKDGVYALISKRGSGTIALTTESVDEVEEFLKQKADASEQPAAGWPVTVGRGAYTEESIARRLAADGRRAEEKEARHAAMLADQGECLRRGGQRTGGPLHPPADATPTIGEMFFEHQEIYHRPGPEDVPEEHLDRMHFLHEQILATTALSAPELAQQLIVHHCDGDNLADTDELMGMLRPIAGVGTEPPARPVDLIFSTILWHRRTVREANAALDARTALEDVIPEDKRQAAWSRGAAGEGWTAITEGPDDDERWTAANAACNLAFDMERAAADSMVRTRPTSLAGILALASYAVELACEDDGWPAGLWHMMEEPQPEHGIDFPGALFSNIAATLRATLPRSVVLDADLVSLFGQADTEARAAVLDVLRNGQRAEAEESAA